MEQDNSIINNTPEVNDTSDINNQLNNHSENNDNNDIPLNNEPNTLIENKNININKEVNINKSIREYHFKEGNTYSKGKGRPKNSVFSLKQDLINSLKRIKSKDKKKYQEIIDSYWDNPNNRKFLLEIIDGKAKQTTEQVGDLQNPIRIIEVKQMEVLNITPANNTDNQIGQGQES